MAAKRIIIANWKMNPSTFRDARRLFDATKKIAERSPKLSFVIAPPALYLRELASGRSTRVAFGAQSAHFERAGSHTGELSMQQARDARASYVLVGHAERRQSGETNDDTRKKVAAALAAGLTPILCVGESKREQGGEHFEVVRAQLKAGFADVADAKIPKVLVAYEPVWAIGAERPLSPRDMQEMSIFIRKTLVDSRGAGGHALKVLYGGSIDETNAAAMFKEGEIAGVLLGRASISVEHLAPLAAAVSGL